MVEIYNNSIIAQTYTRFSKPIQRYTRVFGSNSWGEWTRLVDASYLTNEISQLFIIAMGKYKSVTIPANSTTTLTIQDFGYTSTDIPNGFTPIGFTTIETSNNNVAIIGINMMSLPARAVTLKNLTGQSVTCNVLANIMSIKNSIVKFNTY